MKPADIKCAGDAMKSFVKASIARYGVTGVGAHVYKFPVTDIKEQTKRSRMKQPIIDDYIQFFQDSKMKAVFMEVAEYIRVSLDLENCSFDLEESELFCQATQRLLSKSPAKRVFT